MTRPKKPKTEVPVVTLVGYQEIAARLNVSPGALRVARHRGTLPTPVVLISGMPVWLWPEIARWARKTGKL